MKDNEFHKLLIIIIVLFILVFAVLSIQFPSDSTQLSPSLSGSIKYTDQLSSTSSNKIFIGWCCSFVHGSVDIIREDGTRGSLDFGECKDCDGFAGACGMYGDYKVPDGGSGHLLYSGEVACTQNIISSMGWAGSCGCSKL